MLLKLVHHTRPLSVTEPADEGELAAFGHGEYISASLSNLACGELLLIEQALNRMAPPRRGSSRYLPGTGEAA
jgi:hypothetical protein